ncbi:MAG: amino acid adenylation domain-containing protein [Ruminococcaceae bacterium]|nr:amino acid adenylation domain-containing protein [Oscillospiraceae bacterium]
MQTNILEYLEATAPRLPQKIAYSDGSYDMTFSELLRASRTIGSTLLRDGFRGEAIAILMAKHPRQIATFYGAVYAGCYYVSIDPDMPVHRMESILATVHARVLIVDEKSEKTLKNLNFCGKVLRYNEISVGQEDQRALDSVRAEQIDTDPIYIVFTSGSTGVPKGVVACHRSVIDYVETLCAALGFSEDTVFANQTPLFFDAPLKELMPVIKFGATAYLVPKQLFMFPMKLCDFLNEHRVNTVCWVVSALTMISSLGVLEKNPPRYLRTVAFGSEVFPIRQYELWRAALPDATFFNLYGPTEATGMSCYWKADRALADGEAIPIGRPFRNTDLMLIGEDGKRVSDGQIGEIYLRGTCVTLGYYANPEKTAEAFVQNPLQSFYPETVYRTGDLAYRNPHGELVFVSRRDAQIKHMGHRIELGEIEAAAADCADILRSCAVYDGVKKRIVLYYTGNVAAEDLIGFLRGYLPRYMLPAICERLDRMPLTPNGKLDRKYLTEKAVDA